jgi:probable rRNA maturation factor
MPVVVLSQARHPELRPARLRADATKLLSALELKSADLTVVLTDDPGIHVLNRRYRKKDAPTDVLAFAMREGMRAPGDDRTLGDVVISLDTAARQARRRRRTLHAETRTLLIHGLLHLLGYDHERSAAEAKRMRAKERELADVLPPR